MKKLIFDFCSIKSLHFEVGVSTVKMNSLGRIFLVALLVSLSTAEYTEIIRERCQGSFAIIAHPSPLMCDSFVVCVVSEMILNFIE